MSFSFKSYKIRSLDFVFYTLALFPLFDYGLSAIIVGVFLFVNLITNGIKPNNTWYFVVFYVYLIIISLFYSDYYSIYSRLDNSIYLLIFPTLSSSFSLTKNQIKNFTYLFIGAVLIKSSISSVVLLNDITFLSGGELPILGVDFHATFFSYEILIAMILSYYIIENTLYKNIILIFLSIVVILFQKKIALISLMFLLIVQLKVIKKKYLPLILPFSVLFIFLNKEFFKKLYETASSYLNYTLVGTDKVRLRLFEAGWQNFIEAPYVGKGVVKHTAFFSEYNLIHLGKWSQHMNTHNYFLFLACSGGILALILFFTPYILSFTRKIESSKMFIAFLAVTLIFNTTESTLDRYNGVIPFVVFCFILANTHKNILLTNKNNGY
ncbi:MAG TPA: hypothetical protein EYG89_01075 [Bacteroidia bacterium]|nr:hypothetical protein [Bacteroidia bacterium]